MKKGGVERCGSSGMAEAPSGVGAGLTWDVGGAYT